MADATVTAVETAAKTDVTKVTSVVTSELATLKADVAALEAKTFKLPTVAAAVGAALVVGALVGHFVK